MCFRQDAEFQFFTDLAVGNQVFDGYCPWQNRQSGCPAYRRVCDHSLSEDSPLSAGREGTVSVAHMADLKGSSGKTTCSETGVARKIRLQREIRGCIYSTFHAPGGDRVCRNSYENHRTGNEGTDSRRQQHLPELQAADQHQRCRADHGHCDALFDA